MLAALLFMWLYVALFSSIREQSAALARALQSLPEVFFKALGIEKLDISTIESFLAVEHFSFIWPIMAILLVLAIAGAGFAGQVEQGTAEMLLSRPVSRLKIFIAKYAVGIFSLFVFTIVSVFTIVPLAALHDVDYAIANFASAAAISFLFGWAVFSVAVLFSVIFSEKSRVYMVSGSILVVMYVLNIVAALKESLSDLKYGSFFHFYDYNDALLRNNLKPTGILVFSGVAVACTIAAALWFRKRDISQM
jgi:ABC-2 type transport system permease protein